MFGTMSPNTSTGQQEPLPSFLRTRPLAIRLGVSPRTVRAWAAAGKLTRHVVNPRVVLFDTREVADLLASSRANGTGTPGSSAKVQAPKADTAATVKATAA